MRLSLHIAVCFLLFIYPGCAPEAERDNPFDPAAENYVPNFISGNVFSYYGPREPIDGARIILEPAGFFQYTNTEGYFRLTVIPPGSYILHAEKEGFQSDCTNVQILSWAESQTHYLYLNALPSVENYRIFSEHIDQWWPGEYSRVIFELFLADGDGVGDIDSVLLRAPDISIEKNFIRADETTLFVLKLEDYEIEEGNLFNLIGVALYVMITDKPGAIVQSGPFYLHRIIDIAPFPVSPANFQTVTSLPVFYWDPVELPYKYEQLLQIYQIFPVGSVMIDEIGQLSPTTLQYTYESHLETGTYYWTLGIRDSLGNFSRSKEASFIVQ